MRALDPAPVLSPATARTESHVPAELCPATPRRRARTERIRQPGGNTHGHGLSLRVLRRDAALHPPAINVACPRPATYGACEALALGTPTNPCPYTSCTQHLFVAENEDTGSILYPFGALDLTVGLASGEIPATCALQEAAHDGLSTEAVALRMNLTPARVRQLEARALGRLRATARAIGLADLAAWAPTETS